MPLVLDTPCDASRTKKALRPAIEIGLLNNLGDGGMESGERMFSEMLADAAGQHLLRLRLFSLPSIPRGTSARIRMEGRYMPFETILATRLDGLIVTGCEPHTASLVDEPFWSDLTLAIDWADRHTRSTIWSCLGSHAAVLHLDGIERRPLRQKCSGFFSVSRVFDHRLLSGAGDRLQVVHSRHNQVDAADLATGGYEILTQSAAIGVDTFVKRRRSLFVFLQGHPEYDGGALAREYRRDALRFLEGESDSYPRLPLNYFSTADAKALEAFADMAQLGRDKVSAADLPLAILESSGRRLQHRLYPRALFRNWLEELATKVADRAA